jgi:DNA polymerase I-like protein with 3'-5' exonuclease and polymerase domains
MRLSQLRGLPEDKDGNKDREHGFSLKANTRRFLPHLADYETTAYQWIRENLCVVRGQEGKYISQLPSDLLRKYNESDTLATLQLYWYFVTFFENENYDWTVDHDLYMSLANYTIEAEIRGIKINTQQLQDYSEVIKKEVEEIDNRFTNKFTTEVDTIREQLRQKAQAKYKKKIVTEQPRFNITSKHHLAMLFCDQLKMVPTYTTPKKRPSFKTEYLFQWGEGGKILIKRGKRLLVKSQANSLIEISKNDTMLHPKIRIVGTKTGRTANTSLKKIYGVSFNLQAAARSDKPLMTSLLPSPGNVFVSQDLSRGEPTVTAYYTKDNNYRLVNCEMTGRKPYFDGDLLISDDQYLTVGSITPFARPRILELIEQYGGLSGFGDKWLEDPDGLKSPIKLLRKTLKTSVLALGYGAQPPRIHSRCNEVQCPITMAEATALYEAFWEMYPSVKRYSDWCTKQMRKHGYMYNALGFRCVTEPRKAYNMLIQSSINGIMSIFIQELNKIYTKASPIAIIHDELITEIKQEDIEEYKKACKEACDNLNKVLEWDIPIRTGFAYGNNLYEAK